ncbi:MAG: hypothetical protein IT382_22835 [Deltaproteobacteria bacterium]|nr:hypothetical protein [Deltaproteobacteria bacterium]
MKRVEVLQTACDLIRKEREGDYGDSHTLHTNIGLAWTAILRQRWLIAPDVNIDAEAVLLCMAALKVVREAGVHKDDNLVDGAGYLALAAESATGAF